MGCYAYGRIEVKGEDGVWTTLVALGESLWQSYDFYGSLFGVRNTTGLAPIAEGRGLPPDIKARYEAWEKERDEERTAASAVVGFGPNSDRISDHPGYHNHGLGGDRHSHTWILYSELISIDLDEPVPAGHVTAPGREPLVNRGEAMGACYKRLVNIMGSIAQKHGPDNVRAVVWFEG